MAQAIRYTKSSDGARLAWTSIGAGPPLVRASNWLTHLEYDLDSPVWRHWIRFYAAHFRCVRHDERGCGMSDWEVADLSFPRWIEDLEAVITAAQLDEPFALIGISQGASTAITYAVRHPERVSHLILYGGYARGWALRADEEGLRRYRAIVELVQLGWGKDNPIFRHLFTSRFVPGGSDEQLRWFSELCARTTTPAIASRLLATRADVDVRALLPQVRVPTLVLHARADEVTPLEESRYLASEIPGAELVLLESKNHVLLEHEPAWARFQQEVLRFTGRSALAAPREDARFHTLTAREREVLTHLAAGRTNAQVGKALFISEKTVRNHVTKLFEKLGVSSRAQAIVLAHERGFGAARER